MATGPLSLLLIRGPAKIEPINGLRCAEPLLSDAPETPRAKADGLGPRARARSALARGVSVSGRRIRFALFLTE